MITVNADPTNLDNNQPEGSNCFLDHSTLQRFRLVGLLPNLGDSTNFKIVVNGVEVLDLGTMSNASNDGHGNGFLANDAVALDLPANSRVALKIDNTSNSIGWSGSGNVVVIDRKEEN